MPGKNDDKDVLIEEEMESFIGEDESEDDDTDLEVEGSNDEVDIQKELERDILKNQRFEAQKEYKKTKYKQDSQTYSSDENHNASLYVYDNFLKYGEIENPGVLIEALNLKEGVSYKTMDTKEFNKAIRKVIASTYKEKVVKYNKDANFVTNEEKMEEVLPLGGLDKKSIIAHAISIRSKCFSYLLGAGKAERANPAFVKEFSEVDSKNNVRKKLGYDYDVIDEMVKGFESREDLYKASISNITPKHFKKVYDAMDFYNITDEEGNAIKTIGSSNLSVSIDETMKYIDQYRGLRDIHNDRPWYYFITSYRKNSDEVGYLRNIKANILEVGKTMGFEKELLDLIKSKDRDYDVCKNILVDKMREAYKLRRKDDDLGVYETMDAISKEEADATLENIEAPIETNTKAKMEEMIVEEPKREETRINVYVSSEEVEDDKDNEIKQVEIDPVSDIKDDLHRYAIHGYGMSEKTVYVTEEEYQRQMNPVSEEMDVSMLDKM